MIRERRSITPETTVPKSIEVIAPRTLTENEVKFLLPGDFICEVKYNGVRAVVVIDHRSVRILTVGKDNRTNRDLSSNLRELLEPLGQLAAEHSTIVLDSELIYGEGKTSQDRIIVNSRINSLRLLNRLEAPVSLVPFDVLHLDGHDLRNLELMHRKELLHDLFSGEYGRSIGIKPPKMRKRDFEMFAYQTVSSGYEGLVFKRRNSLYIPSRTRWLKHKFTAEELAHAKKSST